MTYDLTRDLVAFESGELDDDATLLLFQELVNTGMAWSLQGYYGRMADELLDLGLIHWADRK